MRVAILVLLSLCLSVLAVPSLIVALDGGFRAQAVGRVESPDGRLVITVSKRAAFPANEWIDPRTVVILTLARAGGHVVRSETITLAEDSDFAMPQVSWDLTGGAVRVQGLDSRNPRILSLATE